MWSRRREREKDLKEEVNNEKEEEDKGEEDEEMRRFLWSAQRSIDQRNAYGYVLASISLCSQNMTPTVTTRCRRRETNEEKPTTKENDDE